MNKKKCFLILAFLLFQAVPGFSQPAAPKLESVSFSPIASGRYANLNVDSLTLKDYGSAPSGPCLPGQLFNGGGGTIYICDSATNWGTIAGHWIQTGNFVYPEDLTWRVGIGTATPSADLEVYNDTGGFTALDIVEGNTPETRWTLRAYNSFPILSGSLLGALVIDNKTTPAEADIGKGSLIISQDGKVNIVQDAAFFPSNHPGMLNVQTNLNAIIDPDGGGPQPKTMPYENVSAAFIYNDPGPFDGKAVGIGFEVGPDSANNIIHGAIAVENISSGPSTGARMHFGTDNSLGGNLPIGMTLTERGRLSIGDPAPTVDAHLIITRQTGDPLGEATLAMIDGDFAGNIGRIGFQRISNFTYLIADDAGDIYIDKDSSSHRIRITQDPNANGTIQVYKADGTTIDGFLAISPDSSLTLRARVLVTGGNPSIDVTNSSGGIASVQDLGVGRYRIIFATPFTDIPSVNVSSLGNALISNVNPTTTAAFTVKFEDAAGIAQDTDFNFIVTGKR